MEPGTRPILDESMKEADHLQSTSNIKGNDQPCRVSASVSGECRCPPHLMNNCRKEEGHYWPSKKFQLGALGVMSMTPFHMC